MRLAVVIHAIFITVCAIYCHVRRRRQAKTRLALQIQAIATQDQPSYIYYIRPNPPISVQPPIQEPPPPTYEQTQGQRIGN
jgi:hypothetical protein